MLTLAITKIENERKDFKTGSLESATAEALIEIVKNSNSAAATIANTDKTIKDCSKHLLEIAQKGKEGNFYGMQMNDAEIHIKSFFEIIEEEIKPPPAGISKTIDILNYL